MQVVTSYVTTCILYFSQTSCITHFMLCEPANVKGDRHICTYIPFILNTLFVATRYSFAAINISSSNFLLCNI